jgi:nicotinamide-nucleotide amidase
VKPDEITALAEELGAELRGHAIMAAVAESCTGGGLGEAITRIAGSSAWFDRGFVTYSYEAKVDLLGVPQALLDAHGAVSEETARAMVKGALERSRASVAAAVTGIAGPDGGTATKPVGLVWFAWARNGGATVSESRVFGGDRQAVRAQAVAYALRGLLALLRGG